MKRMLCVLAVAAMLAVPVVGQAQGSFILGAMMGASLFGGSNNHSSAGGATILYVASEDMLKRVKYPFGVKQTAVTLDGRYEGDGRGLSLLQVFQRALPRGENAGSYEILQIARVFRGDAPGMAAIWFCYIEKSSIAAAASSDNGIKENKK